MAQRTQEPLVNAKQWEQYIKQLLRTNDAALYKAAVLIYRNQTEEEKIRGESIDHNSIGYNRWDATYMGMIARSVIGGETLSQRQLERVRRILPKYWRQLMAMSKQKLREREEEKRAEAQLMEQRMPMLKSIEMCSQCGTQCSYGICDECPVLYHNT